MGNTASSFHQDFDQPTDLPALLTHSNIDHIDVSETRLLAIYRTAILDIEVGIGTLDTAQALTVEVLDGPDRNDTDSEQVLSQFETILE